ncbi:hypothetical protein KUTG_02466 [Kutzneria sp. 744]|nr:hypothetical protein KUTG_02466 [Kutzneria sp. 744]
MMREGVVRRLDSADGFVVANGGGRMGTAYANALKKRQGTVQQMLGWVPGVGPAWRTGRADHSESTPLAVTVDLVVREGSGLPFILRTFE